MKGIYLGARNARHNDFNLTYNDISDKFGCDLICDMMKVNLNKYDFVLASPPCNFWSRANYRYLISEYSNKTKNLLPGILENLGKYFDKPFIVENVRNSERMKNYGIFDICNKYGIFYQNVGRHIYFTNMLIDLHQKQNKDFKGRGKTFKRINNDIDRQGGKNVYDVFDYWLNICVPGGRKNG